MTMPRRQGILRVLRRSPVGALAVLLAGSAFLLIGCSGGVSDDPADFPPITADGSETTDASATAGSPTSAGTTEPTSPSTTASTSTTAAPTEKPDLEIPTQWDSDLDEIFGRYLLYWDAVLIAFGPPAADPTYPPLVELVEPGARADLIAQLEESRDAGEILIDPEGSATDHRLRLPNPSLLTKTEGNEVIIQDCFINGWVAKTLDGEVVDDKVVANLKNVLMEVFEGEWRVSAVRNADPGSDGYQECKDSLEQP